MIMHLADSNALRAPGLERYLTASSAHAILLSDWTINEMQKKNALSTSRDSLRLVAKFPDQSFALRPTHDILDERVETSSDAARLIDHQATLDLIALARDLRTVPVPADLEHRMAGVQLRAATMMERLKAEVTEWEGGLVDATRDFTSDELANFRKGEQISDATRMKLFDLLRHTTADFMIRNQAMGGASPMRLGTAATMFGFRYSLCTLIYYLQWVQIGRQRGMPVERRMNDVIDLQLAAVGTYFSGVLSGDKMLQRVSGTVRPILRGWGTYVGPDWAATD